MDEHQPPVRDACALLDRAHGDNVNINLKHETLVSCRQWAYAVGISRRCTMPHSVAPLPFKPPRLDGLSERLLASHYENNYGGALRRLNAIDKRLKDLDWAAAPVFDVNGLKREELIAAGSVILHEIYFDGLGGSGGDPSSGLAAAIERDFGSVERWRAEFTG